MMALLASGMATTTIPTAVAFLLAPHASLQSWLAVSALPEAAPLSEDAEKRGHKRRKFVAALALCSFFALEFYAIAYAPKNVLDRVVMVVLSLSLQISMTLVLAESFRAFKWAAFRAPSGRAHFRIVPQTKRRLRMAAAFLTAGAVNSLSVYCPHEAISSFVVGALVYRMSSAANWKTVSIRGIAFVLLAWIALTFTLSGVLIAVLLKSGKMDDLAKEVEAEEAEAAALEPSEALLRLMGARLLRLFMNSWISAVPGLFIAILYRFDYSQHTKRLAEAGVAEVVEIELVDPPKGKRFRDIPQGVVVPTSVARGFRRPYYQVAYIAWLASQLTCAVNFYALPFAQEEGMVDVLNLIGLAVEVPVMVVAIFITAKLKGDFRAIWTYREVWNARAARKSAQAPRADVESVDGDEKAQVLPAYSDLDVEEGVPAYEETLVDIKN